MLFNSLSFLIFFPIVVGIYFIIPQKIRWVWLLISSYYYYMSWNAKYASLLALSTVITWLSGLLIEKCSGKKNGETLKKALIAFSFLSNLAILFIFKYFHFGLNALNKVKDETPEIILKSVYEDVESFVAGQEVHDDITMLCIEYLGEEVTSNFELLLH